MSYLHSREFLFAGDIIEVDCSHECNVLMLSDINFENYRAAREFDCLGGFRNQFPARICAPSPGYWNIGTQLGGRQLYD